MDEFAERVMKEIADRREVMGDDHNTEMIITGLKRAVVLAVGQERAERVFAAHDESY